MSLCCCSTIASGSRVSAACFSTGLRGLLRQFARLAQVVKKCLFGHPFPNTPLAYFGHGFGGHGEISWVRCRARRRWLVRWFHSQFAFPLARMLASTWCRAAPYQFLAEKLETPPAQADRLRGDARHPRPTRPGSCSHWAGSMGCLMTISRIRP